MAGATRGAGRGIALAFGEAGATVYCTGRSVKGSSGMPGRPETIDETAQLVTARGGRGIAVRTDHGDPSQVKALVDQIAAEQGRLDILVNDIWGANPFTKWGQRFWEHPLEDGRRMLRQGLETHIITAHVAGPLIVQGRGIIVEITDGTNEDNEEYRENLFYDLVKTGVNRLAFGMNEELAPFGAMAVAVTPGFLRSEEMLDLFGVREENWRDAIRKDPYFAESETPAFVGRAVACLVADPNVKAKAGGAFSAGALAKEYGFRDVDGRQPDFAPMLEKYRQEKRKGAVHPGATLV